MTAEQKKEKEAGQEKSLLGKPEKREGAGGRESLLPSPASGNREAHQVWLSLGSNLGDRLGYLLGALRLLTKDAPAAGLLLTRLSGIYETEPVGYPDQPEFYNLVLKGETWLRPLEVLALCQKAEQAAQRRRLIPWGPRTLDVDVLLYDCLESRDPRLILPHPRMHQRAFVLGPLAEVDPEVLAQWGFPALKEGIRLKIPAGDVKIMLEKGYQLS